MNLEHYTLTDVHPPIIELPPAELESHFSRLELEYGEGIASSIIEVAGDLRDYALETYGVDISMDGAIQLIRNTEDMEISEATIDLLIQRYIQA